MPKFKTELLAPAVVLLAVFLTVSSLLIIWYFGETLWGFLLGIVISISALMLFNNLFPAPYIEGMSKTEENRDLPSRQKAISSLLAMAKQEIIIFSGCLNHQVYDHQKVIEAMDQLLAYKKQGGIIDISIYLEQDIDPQSIRFLEAVKQLNGKLYKIEENKTKLPKHAMIIDKMHVRLEKTRDTNIDNRPAMIRYYDSKFSGNIRTILMDRLNDRDNVTYSELN